MKQTIPIEFCLTTLSDLPIIDVRSPSEYKKGHLPNAIAISLFTDDERAEVGTTYKQVSKEKAIELGYQFVTPKLEYFFSQSLAVAPKKEVVVYCWRGGLRSNAFGSFLEERGFEKIYIVEGGYKAYRNYIFRFFEKPFILNVLGGYTGSGKTEILHCLAEKSEQVIDLEGLANHRGSAFGGIDLPPQPTTEQFENNLYAELEKLDINKPIWIEDESSAIGKINLPIGLYNQMRIQYIYFLNISQQERAKHLVATYANLNAVGLSDAIGRISKRLGYDKAKLALQELKNKNYEKVVELVLEYYDKYYLRGLQKRDSSKIIELKIAKINPVKNATYLINLKR